MSGVIKGVKKVFKKVVKGVKKIFKSKVFRVIAIAAATFFTAGVATAGFGSVMGSFGTNGVLATIGKTIGVGFQAVAGSLGLGSGVSASMGSALGVAPGTTLGSGALATSIKGMFGAGGATTAATKAAGDTIMASGMESAAAGSGGILGGLVKGAGKFLATPGGMMLAGNMIQGYAANKAKEDAWKRMSYFGISNGGEDRSQAIIDQIRQGNPFAYVSPTTQQAMQPQQQPGTVPQYADVPYDGEQQQPILPQNIMTGVA